jgi:hypothetical protein
MKEQETNPEMTEERDPNYGFWIAKRRTRVYATQPCFGFRGRLWDQGEMAMIEPGEKVPHHFHSIDEMPEREEVPPFGSIPPSAFNAALLKG